MAPFADAWPPDDRPLPWDAIDAERIRMGPLNLPVTYRDLPSNPHQSGVVKPPPTDAVAHTRLAWTRETLRRLPGLFEHDRLLPTDLLISQEPLPDGGDTYAKAIERQRAAGAPPKVRRAPKKRKTLKELASGERTAVGSASAPPAHSRQDRQPPASNQRVRLVDAYRRLIR